MSQDSLLEVRGLKTWFPVKGGAFGRKSKMLKAVDGVSFELQRGETLGLVGESGCGKTTTGRSILRLVEATEGEVLFDGEPVFGMNRADLRAFRRRAQIIFQDPFSSLNPRMPVGAMLKEVLQVHRLVPEGEEEGRVSELLTMVGLEPEHASHYPHQFSGGQRQRIGIARALAVEPELIICDEPVSALDVSIQAQILNLLRDLQKRLGLTYLFIAHDLSVVRHLCDRVAVMYLGKIVELAPTSELFSHPRMPYTRALLSAVPVPDPTRERTRIPLEGDVPSPVDPPTGCPFHPRCPHPKKDEQCRMQAPALEVTGAHHAAACHYPLTDDS